MTIVFHLHFVALWFHHGCNAIYLGITYAWCIKVGHSAHWHNGLFYFVTHRVNRPDFLRERGREREREGEREKERERVSEWVTASERKHISLSTDAYILIDSSKNWNQFLSVSHSGQKVCVFTKIEYLQSSYSFFKKESSTNKQKFHSKKWFLTNTSNPHPPHNLVLRATHETILLVLQGAHENGHVLLVLLLLLLLSFLLCQFFFWWLFPGALGFLFLLLCRQLSLGLW